MNSTLEKAFHDAVLRSNTTLFLQRCLMTLNPGRPFLNNWHIQAILYQLDRIRRGEITRLIINMPPRSLKSIVTSVAAPAFILGHDPAKRLIVVTYGAELGAKHANDFRATFVDIYEPFVGHELDYTFEPTGSHPNDLGYQVIAQQMISASEDR